ncbi:hypothetical protein BVZ13_02130 [Vibrio cholerae]|nr:conserved hypothetical protein [Vibrio cholerae O395]EGQ8120116.1 hypothetical protein [Vibrio cholerae]OFJ36500.1 hypothetical protein BFX33_05895 [Vibrio cholerae V52]QHQ89691.1 hypothetical protein FKV26_03710 [Vibrio cholerae O1]EGQ9433888.1 hypothetical protein [Vibrio cholerae]
MCESREDSLLIQLFIFISTIRKRAHSARFFHFYLVAFKESESLAFLNHPNFFGKAA